MGAGWNYARPERAASEEILPEHSEALSPAEDPLDGAQLHLLGLWKEKQSVGRRLPAYDSTNFYS